MNPKRLHFIGIGGTGMRPLAELAIADGFLVSGSDQSSSISTEFLAAKGASITIGHSPDALPDDVGTLILSSAIASDNSELTAARDRGWTLVHRSDFLKELMKSRKAICVGGTHGKTSTTAMLAFMLEGLGLDPRAAIGGEMVGRSSYALTGNGPYFVAECDESDGTFLKYDPFISIITNIDLDHLDYYKDLEGLKSGFLRFAEKTAEEGTAIFGWDNAAAREVAHLFSGNRLSFGQRIGSEVRLISFKGQGLKTSYEAVVGQELVRDFIPLIGRYSVQNVLCCLAVAAALELDLHAAAAVLRAYPGVKRRFSLVATAGQIKIFDDYAHNPGKIRSCIEGAREAFPLDKLLVIFQPHRYSRLETMYNELMASFAAADEVFVLPVYAAGETSQRDFSPANLARDLSLGSGVKARAYDHTALEQLLRLKPAPIVLITIGAGDVWELSLEWKEFLNGQEASQAEGTPSRPTS